jgi:hypothetical protein
MASSTVTTQGRYAGAPGGYRQSVADPAEERATDSAGRLVAAATACHGVFRQTTDIGGVRSARTCGRGLDPGWSLQPSPVVQCLVLISRAAAMPYSELLISLAGTRPTAVC